MSQEAKKYKGVAFFGPPGSGKTTIAKAFVSLLPRAEYVEAFGSVIAPAAAIKGDLPEKEKNFLRLIGENFGKASKSKKGLRRRDARAVFKRLLSRYSPAVVAKALIRVHQKKFPEKFAVIAGTRGLPNARFFKKSGYLVVYLKAPKKCLAERLAMRENISLKDAKNEMEAEERLFSTAAAEKTARLSFNTAGDRRKEIAAEIKSFIAAEAGRK